MRDFAVCVGEMIYGWPDVPRPSWVIELRPSSLAGVPMAISFYFDKDKEDLARDLRQHFGRTSAQLERFFAEGKLPAFSYPLSATAAARFEWTPVFEQQPTARPLRQIS
jgi:hypothetical protein